MTSETAPKNDVFSVTMLGVLRHPFEEWLASRGLEMGLIPGTGHLIVVPVHVPAVIRSRHEP